MIIKKKYTVIKKTKDAQNENITEHSSVNEILAQENTDSPQKIVSETIEKQEEKENQNTNEDKNKADNFDSFMENIKFDPREERREGTRRRGYRRTQDRNIVSRAQEDAKTIKDVARQEGYNAGIEEAKKDLENLNQKLAEFFNYKDEVFQKVSECIMDISVEIAKKIINKEVETNNEYIISEIKGVIEEINKVENKIILRVMPKDVEIVKDRIPQVFAGNYFEADISVVPDKEIKEGGVIVETSNGIIDATIETQLAVIEKALKKHEESRG